MIESLLLTIRSSLEYLQASSSQELAFYSEDLFPVTNSTAPLQSHHFDVEHVEVTRFQAACDARMATYPYNPTIALSSPTHDLVYIFQSAEGTKTQLLAVNVSATFDANNLPYSTVSATLPFLQDDQSSFTPVIDQQGNISVYAGDCGQGSQTAGLWTLAEPFKSLDNKGTWQKIDVSVNIANDGSVHDGPNYLAGGVAFAANVNATAGVYIFGGMCPTASGLTATDWTQSANYSNTMLSLQPNQPSAVSSQSDTFSLSIPASRGPPIAEAGFTMTALSPTFSNANDGETQSQNQNFVLVGGHTQAAFINMSQIALFSLPEQSWAFLPVMTSNAPNTDLVRRDSVEIDSRSGHTTLLSSDGTSLIVFGGWVGDVSQIAEPQYAVLEIGGGYGGTGDWKWTVPVSSGPGPATGSGVYGHGAVLLPGDIMMIAGGYNIPAGTGSKRKRQATSNSKAYFLNVTSNTWIESYNHPKAIPSSKMKDSTSNSAAKRVGLGAGLTLGVLAIIVAVILYFWYSRRLKKKREARDEDLRRLSSDPHAFHSPRPNEVHYSSTNPEMTSISLIDEAPVVRHQTPQGFRSEPEAERTGMLFEVPSPTRGLRRSLHTRGVYQPAPRFDNGRRTPDFMNSIHPIDERDEYEEETSHNGATTDSDTIQPKDSDLLTNVPILNPFRDPDGSRSPSPQSPQAREQEIRQWVEGWSAADAYMYQHGGRLSPEKNDRTSSTLSDQSARSLLSSSSWQPSAGSVSRTISQRSAALFSAAPLRVTNETIVLDNNGKGSGHNRSNSARLYPGAERNLETPTSFATAKTSLAQQHGEDEESSPTKMPSRARGFMGSLRRAFVGDRSQSTSPEHPNSSSSSPTKANWHDVDALNRSASTGAGPMFWKSKQGAKDWEVGQKASNAADKSANSDEWDVESAVQNRLVQVMFTVPKDKLRVVNRGDEDNVSILSTNENSVVAENEAGPKSGNGKE